MYGSTLHHLDVNGRLRFHSSLLHATGQAIIATDTDGCVLFWNSAAEQLYGWSEEEALGKDLVELVVLEDRRESAAARREALLREPIWVGESIVLRRDGSHVPISITNSRLYGDDGKVIGFVGISSDISERKRVEEERLSLIEREQAARKAAERARDEAARLQRVTAALSSALTQEDVAQITVEAGVEALGAHAAFLAMLTDGGEYVHVRQMHGMPSRAGLLDEQISMEEHLPVTDSVRSVTPVYLSSMEEWTTRFGPPPQGATASGLQGTAAIPLIVNSQAIGALVLRFIEPRDFGDDERGLIVTLVQQCANAMDRARLYATEHAARVESESTRDELRASEDRWRTLVEMAPDGILVASYDGTLKVASDRSVDLFGYASARAMVGLQIGDMVQAEDRSNVMQALATLANGDGRQVLEAQLVRHDSTTFDGELTWAPMRSPDSTTPDAIFTVRDISARKAADVMVRRYAVIVQSSSDAIVATDASGIITNWNRGAERLYGFSAWDMVGRAVTQLIPESIAVSIAAGNADSVRDAGRSEMVYNHTNGQSVDVSLTISPIKNAAGVVTGRVYIGRDVTEQRRQHEALLLSEERYRGLIEASPDGIVVSNAEHRIVLANVRATELLSLDESGGAPNQLAPSVFLENTDEVFGENCREIERSTSRVVLETILRSVSGSAQDIELVCQVLPSSAPSDFTYVSILRDVSARNQADEEIRRYAAVVRASSDAILSFSLDGSLTSWNPGATELLGYTAGEMVGTQGVGLWPPDRAGEFDSVRDRIRSGDNVRDLDTVRLHKDGTPIHVSVSASAIRDSAGEIVGMAGIIRNIGDRLAALESLRRAQEETWRSREQLRIVLETMTEAVLMTDVNGTFTYANAAASFISGVPRERILGARVGGSPWSQEAHTRHAEPPETLPIPLALATGQPSIGWETDITRSDGELITISMNCAAIRNEAGEITGTVSSIRDITERKYLEDTRRKEEELETENSRMRELDRLKSQFLASMSHELRTPLNAIIGFAELLRDGSADTDEDVYREYVDDILSSGWHLLQIVNDILDLSKIEAGEMHFARQSLDIVVLARESVKIVQVMAAAREITLTLEQETDSPPVIGDAFRVRQILYNYLSNAIKFTPPGGSVTVRVRSEGADYYRLEVEDTGIGLSHEDTQHLFHEFQQLGDLLPQRRQGTGLGLAITKRIVEALGGYVGVESELGAGSTFYAVLPSKGPARDSPRRKPV